MTLQATRETNQYAGAQQPAAAESPDNPLLLALALTRASSFP